MTTRKRFNPIASLLPDARQLSKLVKLDLFAEGGYDRLIRSLRKMAEKRGLETTPATTTPSNITSPAAGTSLKVLNFAERRGLIERLLACPSLSNPGSRETVISSLPSAIAHTVMRSSQATMDLSNLLTVCLIQPKGLQNLLEVLEFFEQGSLPFQELKRYTNPLIT